MTRTLWLLLCLSLPWHAGCLSLSEMNWNPWSKEQAPVAKPQELVAIWQEGVDVQLDPNQGGMPVPGFSGRVLFHELETGNKGRSVAVKGGTLLISFYEDKPYQGPPQPLETWTILPEHLPMLLRKDLSGWGYALWLPWNTYQPHIRSGRLVVQYTTRDGEVLRSPPVRIQTAEHQAGGLPKPQLQVQHLSQQAGKPLPAQPQ
ncbi:MAG TPA: hypothetical protein PKA06_01190 [Gemmatales bacterium]|nr:hypothetical protein [Gemmatales bacterium]